MKKRFFYFFILICLTVATVSPGASPAHAEDPGAENLLQRMEKKYAHRAFRADFHQISTLTALDATETASGTVYFSHPGKMRWEYEAPSAQQIISDGTHLWIYRPDEYQVVVGDARSFFSSGAGGAFLSNMALIREQYNARIAPASKANTILLILEPVTRSSDIDAIHIKISSENDTIVQVTTFNPYGDTTTLDFWNIEFGPVAPEKFQFQVPQGVDLIEMD